MLHVRPRGGGQKTGFRIWPLMISLYTFLTIDNTHLGICPHLLSCTLSTSVTRAASALSPPPPRLIREEAQRMGSRGASDDVAVPFGRIQEFSAKYNLTVGLGTGGRALGEGHWERIKGSGRRWAFGGLSSSFTLSLTPPLTRSMCNVPPRPHPARFMSVAEGGYLELHPRVCGDRGVDCGEGCRWEPRRAPPVRGCHGRMRRGGLLWRLRS